MSEDTPLEQDDSTTTNSNARWTYIGTVLAFALVTSLPILLLGAAYGLMSLSVISQAWFTLYAVVVLMAATWAFGEETLNAVQRFRKKR